MRIYRFLDIFRVLAGWREDFTGSVIDYGTYPDQGRNYYTLYDSQKTLSRAHPGHGIEAAIYAGLDNLIHQDLMNRTWKREDGLEMGLNFVMIDANWGTSTRSVRDFCRRSPFKGGILPSHGRYVRATTKPMSEWGAGTKRAREKVGLNWRTSTIENLVHILYDTNYWKSFSHERLSVPFGDPGSLTLFGSKPTTHRMFGDHLTAEYRNRVESNSRAVDEWQLRPERPDNHFLDGLVGCAVGASVMGCSLKLDLVPQVVAVAGKKSKPKSEAPQTKQPTKRKPKRRRRKVTYL